MGEVNLRDALEKIRSTGVTKRDEGLADLKTILGQNGRSSNIEVLPDKAFHEILEILFRVAKVECSTYAHSSKQSRQTLSAGRLSECAGVLRLAVKVGVRKLHSKTVKALVDHVTQTLPTSDSSYCEPLITDYFKALRIVLEYSAHVEHLPKDNWHDTVDFCLECLNDLNRPLKEVDSGFNVNRGSYTMRDRLSTRSKHIGYGSNSNGHDSQITIQSQIRGSAEDLILCVRHLVSAPNAPVLEKASSILELLIDLLHSSSITPLFRQVTFESINSIIVRASTENTSLVLRIVKRIIPLIRRFWQARSAPLKDMLISMLYGEVYMGRLVLADENGEFKEELVGLLEVLRNEYCKRIEREQLQLDDLDFSDHSFDIERRTPLKTKAFELRLGALKAEQPWVLLYLSASFLEVLEADVTFHYVHNHAEEHDNRSKRQRVARPLDEVLQYIKAQQVPERLYGLQVLAFFIDKRTMDSGDLQAMVDAVLPCLSDDNALISSWAMHSMTCAAGQSVAGAVIFQDLWLQIWRLAARQSASAMTCRAACQFMAVSLDVGLVQYTDIADVADNMISSVELNGPADCVDSATTMWSILVILRGKENLGLVSETSEQVLRWLFNHWGTSKLHDRAHVTQTPAPCPTRSIFRLIAVCLGLKSSSFGIRSALNLGPLSQTRLDCLRDEDLIKYLLLDEGNFPATGQVQDKPTAILKSSQIPLSGPRFQALYGTVLDFFISETTVLLRQGFLATARAVSDVNATMVCTTSTLTVIGYAILSQHGGQDDHRKEDLRKLLDEVKERLAHCVLHQEERQDLVSGIFESLGPFLGSIDDLTHSQDLLTHGVLATTQAFGQQFWGKLRSTDYEGSAKSEDEMELDSVFETQRSHGAVEITKIDISHSEVVAATDVMAFRTSLAMKICYLSGVRINSSTIGCMDWTIAPSLMDYLTSLPPQEFLACRPFIRELLVLEHSMGEKDASLLLEYLGQKILQLYEFERCEVSMGLCLEIMTGLAEMWTSIEHNNVSEYGANLYEWFINIALIRGISAPHVHICISSMLQRVIKVRPEYAKSLSLPSARTSLFRVLQEGNISVKFHVGDHISEIFGLFVLKEHDSILGDVIESLPSAVDWIEGIALRLYVLAHLAASWSTLLRRCVYAIFETPGHVPQSVGFAKNCLQNVSKSLGLRDPRELLKLFVSQIIYTWLETQPLNSIPYGIFGYASLPDLLQDVQDEIVGQVVMRGRDSEAAQLAHDLEKPYENLLEVSFSKAAAYSIARDVAVPPSRNTQAAAAESRLRKTLGKVQYTSLISTHFPEILALFFKTIDQEEHIEKSFQKQPKYAETLLAYRELISGGPSEKALPVNQQPSFKAGYLIDEVEHLCHRANHDVDSIWTPELYVYLFRELFNTVHPALGSLHACSVLRRIRILICMAGVTALEHYPVEMALHSLRPFLTDIHCADDAIAISQYLLRHGMPYLKEVPSFLAGLAVSTLTSMKRFLGSTQESTTQESQFKATISKAHTFHTWFADYLDKYTSPYLLSDSANSFKAIVRAARNIQTSGNSTKGTYESDLLLELFEDQRSGRNLLNRPSQDLIFGLLCATFEVPLSFRDDILGSDEQATLYAPIIWKTCQRGTYGQDYLLWAGRVLGRAYVGTGLVDRGMTLESDLDTVPKTTTTSAQSSRLSILRLLCEKLLVDDRVEVRLAEETLRSVVTRSDEIEYSLECEQALPPSLMKGMLWRQYVCPVTLKHTSAELDVGKIAAFDVSLPFYQWIRQLCIALALTAVDDPVLSELPRILQSIEGLSEKAFPYVLHLVLLKEIDGHQVTKQAISEACQQWFKNCDVNTIPYIKILLHSILYLRKQPLPREAAKADRSRWLELDYNQAAHVAAQCSLFKTSLMFLEIGFSEAAKASRRSSGINIEEPSDLLLLVFQQIDEPDAFYGVQQPSSLPAMMARLEYENAGFKSLSFQAANYDCQIRQSKSAYQPDDESMVRVLDSLDLNGLSQSLLAKMAHTGPSSIDSMLRTARKLEQWDISVPASHESGASTVFRAFKSINNSTEPALVVAALNDGFVRSMNQLIMCSTADTLIHTNLNTLAILVEADEVFSSNDFEQLLEIWSKFMSRDAWMRSGSFKHVDSITSCRETIFSSLSKKSRLQDLLKTSQRDARSIEIRALLSGSKMSRHHGALQNALATSTYLTHLVKPCAEVGLDITSAVQLESANVLWGQGEMIASIRMLQDLQPTIESGSQLVHVGKPELLAKLGHQISEARLEKPDEIIRKYLTPAIGELRGVSQGDEAGQVFHEFASFCDQQLQNTDGLEDFQRIQNLRQRKEAEVRDLDKMIKSSGSQARERDNLKSHRAKAKQWFDLDDREFQRLRDSREAFLRQSLENYLLCLKACDRYDNDALRFSALWLEHWDSDIANSAVSRHIIHVGSRKFAPLMNQFASRLLDNSDSFQTLLSSLVVRICIEHPYHGMYQIFTGSKTKGGKDPKALSRHDAAGKVVRQLKEDKRTGSTWLAVHNTNISFVRFAGEKLDDSKIKPGAKVALRKSTSGQRIEQDIANEGLKVPPPTLRINLRPDCDYSRVPRIARFLPEFTVASGISMPKIVTAIGTDGLKYKQLFKGGNDDLRQDSIMEQVFEQVSNLLQSQRATRQRNLKIRTYKVLPLTATSGIIEFVPNTIPLNDYLMPAHQRHFPKDLKPNICRKHIAEAQTKSVDQRIKTFRQVVDHFHPVLRYFFMERFENPDDWFDKRLAYTRSTAAISILGHILGLGDRHGHNILLDEKTGEVVHIDLGIAFEQGRVLPVPEVVPFRLTRDLVDGMGITKTEGVFRRCCEFTLDALRNESYSIMTILDVLRYDPLYSWSLSPLRLKKMQDAQTEAPPEPGSKANTRGGGAEAMGGGDLGERRNDNGEPGEADRALTVVAKKLSKSLSVEATVNELVQQATDERNLAVLFCGWAAYA